MLIKTIDAGGRSQEYFGYADGVSPDGRYLALAFGAPAPGIHLNDQSVIVHKEAAQRQITEDAARRRSEDGATNANTQKDSAYDPAEPSAGRRRTEIREGTDQAVPPLVPAQRKPTRYYGAVRLDNLKLSSSANQVFQEIVQHLEGLIGADVEVTLEIRATSREGI
ncbi:MAG: hypothetical protein ACR2PL_27305, partial [Dehalococcoidia bacterium]